MSGRAARLVFRATPLLLVVMLGACLVLALPAQARLITEDPGSPGFPSDPAFAGSLVIALDETLPARCGDQSFTVTVGGTQFLFQSSASLFGGVFAQPCTGVGDPLPPGAALAVNGVGNGGGPIVITINPPVSAFGIIGAGAECGHHATFSGSQGTESGTSLSSFRLSTPTFLGAADIGGISTVTLSDACATEGSARWTQIRFVPASGVPSGGADVAVSKTPSASAVGAEAPLGYVIGVTNAGTDTANDVFAVDFLPPDVQVDSTTAGATVQPLLAPTTVIWPLGSVPAGASTAVEASLTTPPFEKFSCEDTLLNIAAVATSSLESNLANNVVFTTTRFNKASRAGHAEVCDNGLDDNCNGFVDCNDSSCNTACNIAIATVPGVGGAAGSAAGSGPSSCTNHVGVSQPPCCCDPSSFACSGCDTPQDPNFKASDPPTNVFGYGYTRAGQTITYAVHYENIGTGDAHDVSILDPLHPNLDEATLVINDGGVYDPATRVIVWHDPLTLPPQVPRSVSFAANVRDDAQPGTRVRNRATVVFPGATSPRTDTNFVEHTLVDPRSPVIADLSVVGCTETSPGSTHRRVRLANHGFGFAYNVTAEIVHPPAFVRVTDGAARFAHPQDAAPDMLATVMPLATSTSVDTVSFTTTAHRDVCDVLTWRLHYTTSSGETVSRDVQARPDRDADGVPDAQDRCPNTRTGDPVNREGCSIAQLCPCAAPSAGGTWRNHGAYESCVAHAAEAFEHARLITERQEDLLGRSAAQSSCGRERHHAEDRDDDEHGREHEQRHGSETER